MLIAQTPISSRPIAAGSSVALYLWMRFRQMLTAIAALWLISAIVDRALFAGKVASIGNVSHFSPAVAVIFFVTMVCVPAMLMVAPLIVVSEIEKSMWTLPLRTHTLVGWLTLYGAGGAALCWVLNAVCIWRPAGLDAPIWWPAAMLAAMQAAALAVRCQPFKIGILHALIYYLSNASVFLVSVAAQQAGVAPAYLEAGSLAVTAFSCALAVAGARRTRRGDTIGSPNLSGVSLSKTQRGAFRSAGDAQDWFEWGNQGYYLAAAVAGLGALTLIALPLSVISEVSFITFLTHGAHRVYANMWAGSVLPALVIALLYFAQMIGAFAPRLREGDYTLSPFLATRPIATSAIVASKLRASARGVGAAWVATAPFLLIWMSLTAWEDGKRTLLGAALWRALAAEFDAHAALIAVAGLLFLLLLSWRLNVETLFLQLTGRPWVMSAYNPIFLSPLALPFLYAHGRAHPEFWSSLVNALFFAAALKLALVAYLSVQLRRQGVISAQTLRISVGIWSGAALFCFALLCGALAPYHIAWRLLALGVVLFMPGVRLALAPLALAWNRSR